jgi:RNA polymerase sigma factor (TIGR02999 family)
MSAPRPADDYPSAADLRAVEDLLPVVYRELRQLAAAKLRREFAAQTLQPTALVHEAWLRLGGPSQPTWDNRAHFFAAAAETMRRILIDRARRRRALRRGGPLAPLDLDALEVAASDADERLLAVHEALEKFAALEPRKAELVKLRYFAGLPLEEAAAALDLPLGTAKRWWLVARAWLYRELSTP